MLVITRKFGETVRIGNDVEVIVNRISGNTISLAFDAPRDVRILRGELVPNSDVQRDTDCEGV